MREGILLAIALLLAAPAQAAPGAAAPSKSEGNSASHGSPVAPVAPVAPLVATPLAPPPVAPLPIGPRPPSEPVAPKATARAEARPSSASAAPAATSTKGSTPSAPAPAASTPAVARSPRSATRKVVPAVVEEPTPPAAETADSHGGLVANPTKTRGSESTAARPKKAPDDKLLPPSLTMGALREEMRRAPKEQDREVLKKERERLEETAAALASASDALKKDTARLEALLEKVGPMRGAIKESDEARAKETAALAATAVPGKLPLDVLAKQMRGMKPAEAAQITSRLSRPLAADILQRMPPADAGKILGQMKPAEAAEVAAELASRQPRAEVRK